MAKVDRTVLISNDQDFGQVADPNKLETQITHAFDKIDENDNEFINHKKQVDPTSADTTRDKHVSNNDLKVLQDQITTNLNDLTTHKKQVDPTSSDTTRDKHVANNDLKVLQDQITTNDTASNNRDNTHKNAVVLDHPDQSVTTAKIKDLAVTSEKIAVGAVGRNQLDSTLFEQTANASKFQEIDAQLAEKANQTELDGSVLLKPVPTPNGFSWIDHPLNIWKDDKGFRTDYDVSIHRKTGKTYYVNQSAAAGGDGLTPGTALRKIIDAYNKPDVEVIALIGNHFYWDYGMNGVAITKSVTIKPYLGIRTTLSSMQSGSPTWTKTAGYTKVYETSRTDVSFVVDIKRKNTDGDYLGLTRKESIAECDATIDSYYPDSVNGKVYVNIGSDPSTSYTTNDLKLIHSTRFALTTNFTSDQSLYLENIDILGGFNPVGNNIGNVYAKNCTFQHNPHNNGVYPNYLNLSVFQDCIASCSNHDGFGYVGGKAIEINCIGRNNGVDSNDNGSTCHQYTKIIRINGEYHHNKGPNVVDVQQSESWNLGCFAHDSQTTGTQDCDFQAQDPSTRVFIEGCETGNSDYSLRVSNGAKMYVRESIIKNYSISDTATIEDY